MTFQYYLVGLVQSGLQEYPLPKLGGVPPGYSPVTLRKSQIYW